MLKKRAMARSRYEGTPHPYIMTVVPDHKYHVIEFYQPPTDEMVDWCYNRLDPKKWFVTGKRLYFYNSQDHLMFLLAFSK